MMPEPTDLFRIAVCGHRQYPNDPFIDQSCKEIISTIQTNWPSRKYQVLSCLAEGADRYLASALMGVLSADLIVYLPLLEDEYIKDFEDESSIEEYHALKKLANKTIKPDKKIERPWAYQSANLKMLDNCDLLFCIWDGLPARGPGGTGETIEIARKNALPLFWINVGKKGEFGEVRHG